MMLIIFIIDITKLFFKNLIKNKKKALPRLELGSKDSESFVLTITPQSQLQNT